MVISFGVFVLIFFWEHFLNKQELRLLFLQTDKQIELYSVGKCQLLIFQSVNPLAIILLAPLFSSLWLRLGNRGLEPTSPKKWRLVYL